MRCLTTSLALAVLMLALGAPLALAHDGGEGWYGELSDLVITLFGFGAIAFFPLFALVMSLIQWQLDKRKHRRKTAAKARAADPHWTGGW